MQVPQNQCLSNQTFNSEFVEFVWQFPTKNQIIFKVYKDGTILLEEGAIGDDGEYIPFELSKLHAIYKEKCGMMVMSIM